MTPSQQNTVGQPGSEASVPVPFVGVVLLLFASSALRFPGTFLHPAFWAEDCLFFFRESVETGTSAILAPMYGSYHLLPRLIAFVVSFFPTFWAPVLYAVAAGLLSSLSLALFSRAGFRWLVPDDRLRVVVCWLFSLVPGTYESFFALCTVNYALFCGLLLLLLERDGKGRWQMSVRRALLVSFLWFSVGQGLVLAPLIAYLFWPTRNRNYLLCLTTLAGAVLLNATAENVYRPHPLPGPGLLALIYFENLAVRLAFLSLVPNSWHESVRKMETVPFLLLSVALIGSYLWAAYRARRRDLEGLRALVVAVLSSMALYPLTAVARDYGVTAFTRAHATLGGRAGMVPAVLALLLLWQLLAHPGKKRLGQLAAAGFLAWTTYCILHEPYSQPPRPPLGPAREWPAQAATIDAALRERRAGTLQEPVVIGDIRCRPASSPKWTIRGLTIAPAERPSPFAPPPPRR
jgi:hypothetical protein